MGKGFTLNIFHWFLSQQKDLIQVFTTYEISSPVEKIKKTFKLFYPNLAFFGLFSLSSCAMCSAIPYNIYNKLENGCPVLRWPNTIDVLSLG